MGKANRAAADRRVAQVIAIIGHDRARVDEIKQAIRSLDANEYSHTELWPWPPYPIKKRDKLVARSLGRALGRLEKQLGRHDGAGVLVRAVYGGQDEFFEWRAQLERWRECFEAFAGDAKANSGAFFSPTAWPLGHKPSAARFRRKHDAVLAAAEILESHGLRLTATRKSLTQKASVFCSVAAVLFGKPRASLYHQCRVFIKARNRVSK